MDSIQRIKKILSGVTDPEIPVLTIEDMGILKDIRLTENQLTITITPTYTGCPAMDMIEVNIKAALQEAGYAHVEVISVLSPAWTTDWMTEEGKKKLKEYGIAPPEGTAAGISSILGRGVTPRCPFCDSKNSELISHFGSTPCKALYRCKDCLEPFDYFKCI
ncbi:MAG TPA: phenylacetate-CoA oxygenase subunit PaaJ [Saprospiraceae bacterium]|nr:phenylacetate-CoA oxygenase subunit PaaJ [Saprospiraceae bacterium]